MIKALLVDADGIVFKERNKYFSDRLREDGYKFPKEEEKKFFKQIYPDIRLGRKNLLVEVEKVMRNWDWDKTAAELLEYWFSYENELDTGVLEILKKFRKKQIKLYLASDHSKYRANDIWEKVGLKNYFDGHFFSCDLNSTKSERDFYQKVLDSLNFPANEIVFFDDEQENIDAAKEFGLGARLYKSFEDFEKQIEYLLIK